MFTTESTIPPTNAAPKPFMRKPGTNAEASSSMIALITNQNSQGEDGKGEGEDFQDQPQSRIDEADDDRRNERGSRAIHIKAGHNARGNPDCQGADNPMQKHSQHRENLLTAKQTINRRACPSKCAADYQGAELPAQKGCP